MKLLDIKEVTNTNFEKEVLEASCNQLVMLYYYGQFTLSCYRMNPGIENLADNNLGVKIVRLIARNCELGQRLSENFQINAFPVFIFYKNGKVVEVIKGRKDEQFFLNLFPKLN